MAPKCSEIESLMNNIHPNVETLGRKSLLVTLSNMIERVRDDKAEIEEISRAVDNEGIAGSW